MKLILSYVKHILYVQHVVVSLDSLRELGIIICIPRYFLLDTPR